MRQLIFDRSNKTLLSYGAVALPLYTFIMLPRLALAASFDNPLTVGSIESLFRGILAVVLVFAVPIIVFFIVYAGFLYVTARGNEQAITQANKALFFALVGGLLVLGAYVFLDIIANLVDSVRE